MGKESAGDPEPAWIVALREAKRTESKPLLFFGHIWSMSESYGDTQVFRDASAEWC